MKKRLTFLFLIPILIIGVLLASCSSSGAGDDEYHQYTQAQVDALTVTTVYRDTDSPTGYYVTFRYNDTAATRVRIYGEWLFTDLAHGSMNSGLDALPADWKDGYFVYNVGSWPTADMSKTANGVWSYTIPLPAGRWSYRFLIGGEPAPSTSTEATTQNCDPSNPTTINIDGGAQITGENALSSIYVPIDLKKQQKSGTAAYFGDWSEQAPHDSQKGTVSFVNLTGDDGNRIPFGVYLPYQHDKNRAAKYPILVLYHGGGGTESSWINSGGIQHIMDNMIAQGRIEPTIVVTPTSVVGAGFAGWNRPQLLDNVLNKILPYMVENYNAATDSNRRAFAGLSMGGATTGYALFHHTTAFKYYGLLSPPMTADVAPDYTIPDLKTRTIFFAYGWWDFVCFRSLYSLFKDPVTGEVVPIQQSNEGSLYEYLIGLKANSVPYTNLNLPSGHVWVLWRKAVVHFAENILWK
jgi:enterochelin esterase-like enzyme